MFPNDACNTPYPPSCVAHKAHPYPYNVMPSAVLYSIPIADHGMLQAVTIRYLPSLI